LKNPTYFRIGIDDHLNYFDYLIIVDWLLLIFILFNLFVLATFITLIISVYGDTAIFGVVRCWWWEVGWMLGYMVLSCFGCSMMICCLVSFFFVLCVKSCVFILFFIGPLILTYSCLCFLADSLYYTLGYYKIHSPFYLFSTNYWK